MDSDLCRSLTRDVLGHISFSQYLLCQEFNLFYGTIIFYWFETLQVLEACWQ